MKRTANDAPLRARLRIPEAHRPRRVDVRKALPAGASERAIQEQIRWWLAWLPWCVFWRNNVGLTPRADGGMVRYGLGVGSADLIGIVYGTFVALEVKRPGGKVSDAQEKWIDLVWEKGGRAWVVSDVRTALAHVANLGGSTLADTIAEAERAAGGRVPE